TRRGLRTGRGRARGGCILRARAPAAGSRQELVDCQLPGSAAQRMPRALRTHSQPLRSLTGCRDIEDLPRDVAVPIPPVADHQVRIDQESLAWVMRVDPHSRRAFPPELPDEILALEEVRIGNAGELPLLNLSLKPIA